LSWIQTYTRKAFDVLQPNVHDVELTDIVVSLSHTCRFNGHCREFYSVLQHSAIVAERMAEWNFHANTDLERHKNAVRRALLHDAGEAYISDIPRPVKSYLCNAKVIEGRVLSVIHEAFGVRKDDEADAIIKFLDNKVLITEARSLLRGGLLDGWGDDLPEPFEELITPWPTECVRTTWFDAWTNSTPTEERHDDFQGQWTKNGVCDGCEAGYTGGEGEI
jgi:hypothetical protein